MNNNSYKKYKIPKRKTTATTNPQASKKTNGNHEQKHSLQPRCPLLAKDSEWLDVLQTSSAKSTDHVSEEEEVLQLVECEDGSEMKPLTIMFPGLLEIDQKTLEDMLNKTMSTTEVTKHLVGQKADFSLMKKVNRLIPSDKKWLETLSEDSHSVSSIMHSKSKFYGMENWSNNIGSVDNEVIKTESTIDISDIVTSSVMQASSSNSENSI